MCDEVRRKQHGRRDQERDGEMNSCYERSGGLRRRVANFSEVAILFEWPSRGDDFLCVEAVVSLVHSRQALALSLAAARDENGILATRPRCTRAVLTFGVLL
eukprot:2956431-Pleurochrysis_carterae.AAC.2